MYRFRSVENLIGEHQELEKQQIYMAAIEQLNDPMEGKRRYFWKGDKILWENFFKHYILCLEHVIFLSRLLHEDETIKSSDIPIYKSEDMLPTEIYKERIKELNKNFFSDRFIQEYINFIVSNPNKKYSEEMYVHLKTITGRALDYIFESHAEAGFISKNKESINREEKTPDIDLTNVWSQFKEQPESEVIYTEIMDFLHTYFKEKDSESLYIYKDYPKLQSIFVEFPQMYLDKIVDLLYPKVYIACFMDNCSNSSVWGTYGNNHTGVCLKFKTDLEKPKLSLKTIVGYSSKSGKNVDFKDFTLKPIKYSYDYDELDFFKNIGKLPFKQLKEQWYSDDEGNLSQSYIDLFSNEDVWRSQYWGNFEYPYLLKTPDWSHEKEYRIMHSNSLNDSIDHKDRLLEYKFEDLESIIFGMKTPVEARTKIIEIINKKCDENNRESFDFYEMEFSTIKKGFYPRKILTINKELSR